MVKYVFLHNSGQRNAFAYVSFSNRSRCVFDLLKVPEPSNPMLKFGNNLTSSKVKVKVICEDQQVFSPPPTHKYTCEVSLKSYCQFFRYHVPIVGCKLVRRKKEERMTQTLWHRLTLCDTNYAMKEQPDVKVTNNLKIFPRTFNWHVLVSIHCAVM